MIMNRKGASPLLGITPQNLLHRLSFSELINQLVQIANFLHLNLRKLYHENLMLWHRHFSCVWGYSPAVFSAITTMVKAGALQRRICSPHVVDSVLAQRARMWQRWVMCQQVRSDFVLILAG
jgi:hypothetical protein